MGYGYSVDLRERVVKCVKELNLTYVAAASMFSVSVASVNRWLRKERETGSLAPKEYEGGRSHAIKDGRQLNRLKKIIESQPDATIAEITAKYNLRTQTTVSRSSVCRAIQRIGYTRKKKAINQVNPLTVT